MPEISVIVPVYKVENYLECCVRSLQNQTFRDIEIILVDDGSPDNCGVLCDTMANGDDRIRVIHQDNKGVSAARNKGIELSQGQYICFVDSDDVLNPNYCQTLLDLLRETDCDFSACATWRFRNWEDVPEFPSGKIGTEYSNIDFLLGQIERKSEIGPWNKMFKKKALEKIRFKENCRYEDVIFSVDLARYLTNGVIYTDDVLYYYRMQPNGFMATQALKQMEDFVTAGEYLLTVSKTNFPQHFSRCLQYAVAYPWSAVDSIYVKRLFHENRAFLFALQHFLRKYNRAYATHAVFSQIQLHRMRLFAKSRFLYGLNAYTRLARVYLYRVIGKDAYRDGHGI